MGNIHTFTQAHAHTLTSLPATYPSPQSCTDSQTDPHTKMSLIVLKGNHFLLYLSDSDQLLLALQLILEGKFVGLLFCTPLLKNKKKKKEDFESAHLPHKVGYRHIHIQAYYAQTDIQAHVCILIHHRQRCDDRHLATVIFTGYLNTRSFFVCRLYYPLHAIWDTLIR